MTKYAYYPGCSLESLAVSYNMSTLETTRELGLEMAELDDWNCCGATSYFHIDELFAHALVARNIAIAEQEGLDFVAPCSACFKNAYFTNEHMKHDPDLAEHINFALAADNLSLNGSTKVRHLIEVFIEDVGYETLREKVTRPLDGLKVAPYYGCQMVRPRKNDEEIENPQYFEKLIESIGADAIDYASKTRCCGGSLIVTNRKAALDMVYRLLLDAENRGADVIATTCPMCNVNLEVYQRQVNRAYNTDFAIPAMYFTQLIGLALGIAPGRLGIGKELVHLAPSLLA
jgi:heterodisulfide reductase subunit B